MTTTTTTHTLTPWRVAKDGVTIFRDSQPQSAVAITGPAPGLIFWEPSGTTHNPNAAHIVRCVNEREELLAALRMALRNIRGEVSAPSYGATMKTLREVLARAEREEG